MKAIAMTVITKYDADNKTRGVPKDSKHKTKILHNSFKRELLFGFTLIGKILSLKITVGHVMRTPTQTVTSDKTMKTGIMDKKKMRKIRIRKIQAAETFHGRRIPVHTLK